MEKKTNKKFMILFIKAWPGNYLVFIIFKKNNKYNLLKFLFVSKQRAHLKFQCFVKSLEELCMVLLNSGGWNMCVLVYLGPTTLGLSVVL